MEKIIYVCINRTYEAFSRGIRTKGRETLYECTRKYWPVDLAKANQADYIAGVYKGIVQKLYKRTEDWRPVSSFKEFAEDAEIKENPKLLNRYAFTGVEAEQSVEATYIEKKMPGRFYGNIVAYNY